MRAAATGPLHDHTFDVPVLFGPLVLSMVQISGLVLVMAGAGLRPFLAAAPCEVDDATVRRVVTWGTATAGTALLLGAGPVQGMPTGGLAALAVVGVAVPFAVVRARESRVRSMLERTAVVGLVAAAATAATATEAGALLALLVALSFSAASTARSRATVLAAVIAVVPTPLAALSVLG